MHDRTVPTSTTGQSEIAPLPDASPIVLRAHDHARTEISRADTKATALLSVVSLTLAVGVAVAQTHTATPARIALMLAALPIVAAIVVLLATIRPRLTQDPTAGSWLHAAQHGPDELINAAQYAEAAIAEDVCVLGEIAVAKYRRIRRAVDLLMIAAAVFALALTLQAVA